MSGERAPRGDLECVDVVGMLSAYLDGEMSDDQRRRTERHLSGCDGCRTALDQFRTVIRLSGRLTPEDVASLDPLIRDRVLATLRIPRRR
jgi:anti-sigma factor RsiW